MKYAILMILFVNNIFAHSQVLTDSLHNMYYYEISTHIKNVHPFLFCGISDTPITINDDKIDLQGYMEDFYQKVRYCPDLCSGLMHLPFAYYKEKGVTPSELVVNTDMLEIYLAKYPSKRIKLKKCILYIRKYLVRGRAIVNNAHPSSTLEPPYMPELLDKYKMDKLVVVDIENVTSLKIDKHELKNKK